MLPTIFTIPWLNEPIPSYFAMLITGFFVATWLGVLWAKRSKLDKEVVIDLGLFSLIGGTIGARILHVFADGYFWDYVHLCTDPSRVVWDYTVEQCVLAEGVWDVASNVCRPPGRDCFAWAAFWRGGLTYYGGLIGASGMAVWLLRREKFPFWKAADMAGMVMPVGLFFGRIGCFLGGCCFGTITDSPLSVVFPAGSSASESQAKAGILDGRHLESLPVHPAQLYEAFGCLVIAAITMFVVHPKKRFDGMVFLTFLGLYALLRFVVEYFRADDRGGLLGLSTSQLIGLVIVAACAFVWPRLRARTVRAQAI